MNRWIKPKPNPNSKEWQNTNVIYTLQVSSCTSEQSTVCFSRSDKEMMKHCSLTLLKKHCNAYGAILPLSWTTRLNTSYSKCSSGSFFLNWGCKWRPKKVNYSPTNLLQYLVMHHNKHTALLFGSGKFMQVM